MFYILHRSQLLHVDTGQWANAVYRTYSFHQSCQLEAAWLERAGSCSHAALVLQWCHVAFEAQLGYFNAALASHAPMLSGTAP